jgi:DNA polymerase-3 subunit delta'
MAVWRTRGQPTALSAIARAVATGDVPAALLLVGPPGSGKTTLALDLAAGLLCAAADPAARPCRACAACRRVEHGNHPDLHRLAPGGAGRQIRIGERLAPEPGTVRALLRDLALAPMEGAWRVAVIEEAERLNDDAQNALLKLLEEPPARTVLVLCAADEGALLPTVRSRCTRLRLARVSPPEIAALLREEGLADAASAARLAQLADGRPGRARALAAAPEALVLHDRLLRELLDLVHQGVAQRLAAAAGLLGAAEQLETMLGDGADAGAEAAPAAGASTNGSRERAGPSGTIAMTAAGEGSVDAAEGPRRDRQSPGARRRSLLALGALWRGLARDLALVGRGGRAELQHTELLEELVATGAALPSGAVEAFLVRLAGVLGAVEQNANPELALDVLLLTWPCVADAA